MNNLKEKEIQIKCFVLKKKKKTSKQTIVRK